MLDTYSRLRDARPADIDHYHFETLASGRVLVSSRLTDLHGTYDPWSRLGLVGALAAVPAAREALRRYVAGEGR